MEGALVQGGQPDLRPLRQLIGSDKGTMESSSGSHGLQGDLARSFAQADRTRLNGIILGQSGSLFINVKILGE